MHRLTCRDAYAQEIHSHQPIPLGQSSHPNLHIEEIYFMSSNQKQTNEPNPSAQKININAPAGTVNSLGAESVRDGRPATDDSVVEAIDEMGSDPNQSEK
jgi:hypothetical protein